VRAGAMICFDREFPESARLLMLGGAELILVPNACPLDDREAGLGDVRIAQFRGRAFENLVALAMTNYAAPQEDGRSLVCDALGRVVSQAGEGEELHFADLDLSALRETRRREAVREAQRKPWLYGAISEGRD
jgi:predicted amidohydrolase